MIIAVSRITEGTEIKTVVVWKKVEITGPIPVRYIWWAQTMKERKPRTITDQTIGLYPQRGLRVLQGIISATHAIAGRRRTYTSGCPRNQKRCWKRRGLPDPERSIAAPLEAE
jgi:hypothetical protein